MYPYIYTILQVLDDITLCNLDVMDNNEKSCGTLLNTINHCSTAFGMYINTYMYMYIHAIHVLYMYIHAIRVHMCCTCTYMLYVYTCAVHVHTCTCTYMYMLYMHTCAVHLHACYTCTYVLYMYIHLIHVYEYMCVHVQCTCTYINTFIFPYKVKDFSNNGFVLHYVILLLLTTDWMLLLIFYIINH